MDKDRQARWDSKHLELAEAIAVIYSKDPSTKVGAVIVDDRNAFVAMGFNGFPIGIADTDERLLNREIKYKLVVHGEMNAMLFAQRSLRGCTLYTWPFMPCSDCAKHIIQSGIKRVVAPYSDNPRWVESFKNTRGLFKEAGVELVEINQETPVIEVVEKDPVLEMSKAELVRLEVAAKNQEPPAQQGLREPPQEKKGPPKPGPDPLFGFDLSTPKDIM